MIAPSSTMLAYLPSPPQGVWDIGPFPLRAYALCIIVGIVVAVWWGNRRWMARGGQDGEVLDVAIWAVPFGLIGGRLYHLITDWKTYFGADALKEPIDALKIWDGGLGIWGAVALGAVGAWIGARRRGIRLPAFGDAIAPPILLAQAIGRLGNYFNQELYGRETTLPWGLEIYERENAAGFSDPGLIDGVSNGVVVAVVHPTFLYELLWNVLIVVLLVVVDRYFRIGHGRLFALYVAGYCLGRFFVELLRDDRAAVANDIAGIRPNLFTAALVFLAAIIYFVVAPKGREQGLEMYHDDRAAELAEQGVAGYVDDWYDEDLEPQTSSAVAAAGVGGVAAGAGGSSLFDADADADAEDPTRTAGEPAGDDDVVDGTTAAGSENDPEATADPDETADPDPTTPDAERTVTPEPETDSSVAEEDAPAESDVDQPGVDQPGVDQPGVDEPAVEGSEGVEAEADEPESDEPESDEATDASSAVVDDDATVAEANTTDDVDPTVAEPDPTDDADAETDSQDSDSAETDPAETDPAETDPAETDPAETDPAETDPADGAESESGDPADTPSDTDPTDTDAVPSDGDKP